MVLVRGDRVIEEYVTGVTEMGVSCTVPRLGSDRGFPVRLGTRTSGPGSKEGGW